MKKLLVASVLALAVALASQQTASAWHEWRFSAGISFAGRGEWFSCNPYPGDCSNCGPFGGMFSSYYAGPAFGHYGDAGAPSWQAPAPSADPKVPGDNKGPTPAAAGLPQTYSPYYNTGYQPVGYTYPGYSPYQVPSYWYGR